MVSLIYTSALFNTISARKVILFLLYYTCLLSFQCISMISSKNINQRPKAKSLKNVNRNTSVPSSCSTARDASAGKCVKWLWSRREPLWVRFFSRLMDGSMLIGAPYLPSISKPGAKLEKPIRTRKYTAQAIKQ